MNSIMNLKGEQQKDRELGVEGHVEALGWGLGRVTSKSITHTDLHKPNNKLVNDQLEHFWCMDKPHANTNS